MEATHSITTSIPNTEAQDFWTRNFHTREIVPMVEFLRVLSEEAGGFSSDDESYIRAILSQIKENSEESISRIGFGKIIAWYGPLKVNHRIVLHERVRNLHYEGLLFIV